jgi:hypothetical protein
MQPKELPEDVAAHLMEVGLLCSQWAYLEWLLERAIWWFLDLRKTPTDGQTVTAGLSIDALARKARPQALDQERPQSDGGHRGAGQSDHRRA